MNEIVIQNDRLKVLIARPGTVYAGSRFDWTGFVTQVILDGRHTFCAYESLVPGKGTGGIGLCGAFDEMGCNEAAPGDYFPKPGIGLLRKSSDGPYSFWEQYEVLPSAIRTETREDSAGFVCVSPECGGYSFTLEKTLSLEENRLMLRCRLENTGSKPIETEEFVHNFLCVDNTPIGEDYTIRLPYRPEFDVKLGEIRIREDGFACKTHEEDSFYLFVNGYEGVRPHYWELRCNARRAGVRETGDFPVSGFHIWGKDHVISPEIFLKIALKPGEAGEWERAYEFFFW
jgi:hypothetical protein